MTASYTLKRLSEVEDSAPKFGFAEHQESRFANADLEAEQTGVSFHRVKPGKRQAFAHRHHQAEEVYVVLAGSGRVKLDDDIVELERLDALRVAPRVRDHLGDEGIGHRQRHGDGCARACHGFDRERIADVVAPESAPRFGNRDAAQPFGRGRVQDVGRELARLVDARRALRDDLARESLGGFLEGQLI